MAEKVLVIGSGAMGTGIAQVCASFGHNVCLYDINYSLVEKALASIETSLDKRIAKGKLTEEEKNATLANIKGAKTIEECQGTTLVIEAIVENLDIKVSTFQKCEEVFPEGTIMATNTSSLSVTAIAAQLKHPEYVIGLHFFNPVPAMKLVEIIQGLKTNDQTKEFASEFTKSIKKEGVLVKDTPGFLVNRINNAMKNEAFKCLQEGVASIEDIDKAMKFGLGHPMGPFELNDLTGLDIGVAVAESLWSAFRDERWKPFLTLVQLVQSGDLGRKTGKGWYDYTDGEKKPRTDLNL